MGPGRIPAAGIVILVSDTLERRGLVDRDARAAMLVLVVAIRRIYGGTEGRETIGLPGSSQGGGIGLGGRKIIGLSLFRRVGRGHRLERLRGWRSEGMEESICCQPDDVRRAFGLWQGRVSPSRAIHNIPHHV